MLSLFLEKDLGTRDFDTQDSRNHAMHIVRLPYYDMAQKSCIICCTLVNLV